jgi:hypothetical protein
MPENYSPLETMKILAAFISWLESMPKDVRIEVVKIMYADYVLGELPEEEINLN